MQAMWLVRIQTLDVVELHVIGRISRKVASRQALGGTSPGAESLWRRVSRGGTAVHRRIDADVAVATSDNVDGDTRSYYI
jgi:hypothetical protein